MKASFRLILATLAATVTLAGCVQEITPPSFENDKVAPAAEGSRVIAVSFAPQTKTYLGSDGLQPKFNDKDSILISNGEAIDTCEVDVNGDNATISTNLTGPLTAVYPYKAAGMSEDNENQIDTVLVSTVQSGKFADANISMAKMKGGKDESLSFENKTAVFCIYPPTGKDAQHVEVSAEGFVIANDVPTGSAHTSLEIIHVSTTTADSVWVSILVPDGLTVGSLSFSDGTNVKTITDEKAATAIAAGTLYTVTNENWKSPEADIPDGALEGVFTVGAGPDGEAGTADDIKVHFSQGNLYYDGSSFKFEDNQYAAQSSWNANHVSLFFWSRDASVADAENYKDISKAANDVFFTNATAETAKSDFTVNGVAGKYRTLSDAEWQYIFDTRTASTVSSTSNARYAKATVNSKSGIILLPDTYEHPSGVTPLTSINTYNAAFTANDYDVIDWTAMESAGAVFLPAAGFRDGSSFYFIGSNGVYWSSSASDLYSACGIGFTSEGGFSDSIGDRNAGASVRLVTDVSAAPTPEQSLVLGPDMIITKMRNGEPKPGIDNVTYPWIEYVNPTSEPLDDGTAEVQQSNRWTNLNPETGEIGDWIQVTGKNGSVNSPVLSPTWGKYLIFSVRNVYCMQVFATGSASGTAADGNCLKLTATSDDGEVIEASSTPGGIYGKGNASDFCTINLNPKKSYKVKVEAAVKDIQILGIKLINEIP